MGPVDPQPPRPPRWIRRLHAVAPSPWMILVLSVWWAWRYAALPPTSLGSPLVLVGFSQDALLLYGLFGGLRWLDGRSPGPSPWPRRLFVASMLVSATARAVDALQVHLTGSHVSAELLRILAAEPVDQLISLRSLVIAVVCSTGLVGWAARRDRAYGRSALRRLSTPDDARWRTHRLTLTAVALAVGVITLFAAGHDPGSLAPERAFAEALVAATAG